MQIHRPQRTSHNARILRELTINWRLGENKRECMDVAAKLGSKKQIRRVWKRYVSPQLRAGFTRAVY